MGKVKCVHAEYERLKGLFDSVDPGKTILVDELLKNASFLKVELDTLQDEIKRTGVIQKSNLGNVRQSPAFKTYLSTLNTYQTIIRTLNTILGKNAIDEDDEFDDFLKNLEKR
ncbi:hypothetical protein LJC17_02970 [Acholeplasma sp. OttesenSCG-928-E16]|nr:hypothetical protein [Acholeplasma sp. OttesenSCG-928-E16]